MRRLRLLVDESHLKESAERWVDQHMPNLTRQLYRARWTAFTLVILMAITAGLLALVVQLVPLPPCSCEDSGGTCQCCAGCEKHE